MARTIALLVLWPLGALAEPDAFGLGDGRQGTLTVGSGTVTVNLYQPVTANLAPGDTSLPVPDPAGFLPGDLVLVIQLAGFPDQPSGNRGPFSLEGTSVGRWELARVAGTSAGGLG